MNGVLVDTSVWISYFRGRPEERNIADGLDYLLSGDEVLVNDVVLSELIPAMEMRGEAEAVEVMKAIRRPELAVDWEEIRRMQLICLKNGINKVGIPDLMIAWQALLLDVPLFTLDRHFLLMSTPLELRLWPKQEE